MDLNCTPQHLSPEDVAPHIYKWSREELEQMQAAIAGQLRTIGQSSRSDAQRWQVPTNGTSGCPVEWNPF